MKNGLVIADAGPIFSLAIVDKLEILDRLFEEIKIPNAVWKEIILIKTTEFYETIEQYFQPKVSNIKGFNELTFIMDHGESEAVILYKLLNPMPRHYCKPTIPQNYWDQIPLLSLSMLGLSIKIKIKNIKIKPSTSKRVNLYHNNTLPRLLPQHFQWWTFNNSNTTPQADCHN